MNMQYNTLRETRRIIRIIRRIIVYYVVLYAVQYAYFFSTQRIGQPWYFILEQGPRTAMNGSICCRQFCSGSSSDKSRSSYWVTTKGRPHTVLDTRVQGSSSTSSDEQVRHGKHFAFSAIRHREYRYSPSGQVRHDSHTCLEGCSWV